MHAFTSMHSAAGLVGARLMKKCNLVNGVYSFLFRAKASGGHSKARETRDAQFLQKFTRFALIGRGPARPRVCKCPLLRIPLSQSPI